MIAAAPIHRDAAFAPGTMEIVRDLGLRDLGVVVADGPGSDDPDLFPESSGFKGQVIRVSYGEPQAARGAADASDRIDLPDRRYMRLLRELGRHTAWGEARRLSPSSGLACRRLVRGRSGLWAYDVRTGRCPEGAP